MSGYLQRLASRALNPRPSIHPVVDSLFSAARASGSPESPMADEELVSTWPHSRRDAATPTRQSPQASRSKEGTPTVPVETPFMPLVYDTPEAALAGSRQMAPAAAFPRNPAAVRSSTPLPQSPDFAEAAAADESLQSPGRETFRHPNPASVFPSSPRKMRNEATPAGQPDEIQIHIGRIEVTAVPPPPPVSQPKPARKSLNLGEYLKKGDRRAL